MSTAPIRAMKNLIRSNIPAYCAATMLSDAVQGLALSLGFDKRVSGRGLENLYAGIDATIAYEEQIHQEYMRYSGRLRFNGTVCEIGPGGDLGILLMLLGAGAKSGHGLERFDTLRSFPEQTEIYSKIIARHGIDLSPPANREFPAGLEFHRDTTQQAFFSRRRGHYDAIFSASVLEHVENPLALLDQMESALAPGGVQVHIIDLADHGMLGDKRHALAYLTIPAIVYRRMIANSGRPNRVLCHRYAAWAAAPGRHARILVRRLIGAPELPVALPFNEIAPDLCSNAIELVRKIRSKLAREFRIVSDADLAVQEIVLVNNAGEFPEA